MAAKIGSAGIALLLVFSLSCDSQIGPESVAYVQVSPATWSPTALGDTIHFTAIAKTGFGRTLPDANVAWATEPAGVVTVDADGLGTVQSTGTTQVRATFGAVIGTANVHVVQTIDYVIILTYFGNQVAVGDSMLLYVDARDHNSFSVPGATFTLESLNPSIATVSLEGWIKGVSAGEVAIVAMAGGKADTAGFVVTP